MFSFLQSQQWMIDVIPFLMVTADRRQVSFNWADLIKTLMVAGIVAAITMYGTQKAIEKDIDYMKKALVDIRTDVNVLSGKVEKIAIAQGEMAGREAIRDRDRMIEGKIKR